LLIPKSNMLRSCDTNIFLYYLDQTCPEHPAALDYVLEIVEDKDFIISEMVLTELFVLLQNPKIFKSPFTHAQSAKTCLELRSNPHWQVLEYVDGTMEEAWKRIKKGEVEKWQIYDLRLGLTLKRSGVTEFATRNVKDFKSVGFQKIVNPID
jgi:uncharacterized protein